MLYYCVVPSSSRISYSLYSLQSSRSFFRSFPPVSVPQAAREANLLKLKKNQNARRPSKHPPVRGKKKNMNASRPSEHPTQRGKMSKRLGGIIGCKDKTSSWHLNGLPSGIIVTYCTVLYWNTGTAAVLSVLIFLPYFRIVRTLHGKHTTGEK